MGRRHSAAVEFLISTPLMRVLQSESGRSAFLGPGCLKPNSGEYTVKIVRINGGDGCEEHVKIEAEKMTIVRAQK